MPDSNAAGVVPEAFSVTRFSPMTAAQRRASLYVLLLLGPALLIGGGALWLLQREQARLQAEARATQEARREAVAARVRLIAENVGVLLADMQTSLNEILSNAPRRSPEPYLSELQRSNPFVESVVVADAGGRVLWARPPTDDWDPPSAATLAASKREPDALAEPASKTVSGEQTEAAQAVANVAQYQSARSDFRAEVQFKTAADSARQSAARSPSAAASPTASSTSGFAAAERSAAADTVAPGYLAREDRDEPDVGGESIEWIPRMDADHRRLWARRQLADGMSLGISVDLAELRSRLEGVLPTVVERGEVYRLLASGEDESVGTRYANSALEPSKARSTERAEAALSAALLPGWRVVGMRTDEAGGSAGGLGFMIIGGLMVVILIIAMGVGAVLLWREARRQELEALRRTTFVANVSHEFKTPLTTIRLFAELLGQGRVSGPSQQSEYLGTIGEEAARLTRMVENVLSLGRLEAGEHRLQKSRCDVGEVVAGVVARQRPLADAAGVTVGLDASSTPTPLEVDRDAVQQIVTNLLDNALKYGAGGRRVDVLVRAGGAGRGVEIEIADRGPGIPASERERMFESFRRGDERLTAEQGGAGLGLGIARSLARAHGGDLSYEARDGGGARFILHLP